MANTHTKQPRLLLLTITMMSVIGLVASDIFLPALPNIVEHFHISASQGQSMLGNFLFGIALMQLFYGPLSDSLGRRRLLLLGIALFSVTSIAIPYAQDFHQVLLLRMLQAIGACAGITLGRAIVGDLFSKEDAGKVFLTIFPVVGMSPAIAPLIGGQLSNAWGWQACFIFSMLFGLALIALILTQLSETLPPTRRRPLSLGQVAQAYRTLLGTLRFWHYAIIPCVAYSVYFAYIAESPFLLQAQGVPRNLIGYSYISLSATYVAGNLLARRLMPRGHSSDQLLAMGYKIFLAGGVALLLATTLLPHSFPACIAAISILTLGNGFLLPLGTSGAVTCVPSLAGSASGLMGALQIASAALTANYIGQLSQHQPGRFGIVVLALVAAGFVLFHWLGASAKAGQPASETGRA
ncbi:multidrug effflux MFS transporter [Chromobacterium amazonense]|uniref:Bcr/CflA family efflux transporter n=1 Tax=Chromobacterium amazonense TaxID=1382803 RepID=A0ABU8V263_9NEIS|nr:multidrug effflux MFS transporter [Chromobacterium amazonense]MDQ4540065.1 multidrug effflux MFS transporter [Chromobacterium amazonense]